MGYAARANHAMRTPSERRRDHRHAELRRLLAKFPTRSAYEQWASMHAMDDEHRAHLEQFLPAHLRAQGAV